MNGIMNHHREKRSLRGLKKLMGTSLRSLSGMLVNGPEIPSNGGGLCNAGPSVNFEAAILGKESLAFAVMVSLNIGND